MPPTRGSVVRVAHLAGFPAIAWVFEVVLVVVALTACPSATESDVVIDGVGVCCDASVEVVAAGLLRARVFFGFVVGVDVAVVVEAVGVVAVFDVVVGVGVGVGVDVDVDVVEFATEFVVNGVIPAVSSVSTNPKGLNL